MMRVVRLVIIMLVLVLPAGRPMLQAFADRWTEVASPHFTVISNTGDTGARHIAWQLEQIRSAIEHGWPWAHVQLDRPFVVVAARDESTMRTFAPQYWEGKNQIHYASLSWAAPDRHFIVLRTDVSADGPEGVNPYRQSYWAYAELTLNSSFHHRLPFWFSHGLSAVLSNTNVTEKEVQFGRPIPSFAAELSQGRFALADLLKMTSASPEIAGEIQRRRFDAQAWALVHFMLFNGADPAMREARVNDLARLLLTGTASSAAVEQVYGSLAALDSAYRLYVDRGLYRFTQLKADTRVVAKDFQTRTIDPAEALAIRAAFHATTNRPIEARAAIEEARKTAPNLAATFEVEGALLERSSDPAGARRAYERAVELGSTNFYTYIRLAALTRSGGDASAFARARAWLRRATELNPANAGAYVALAGLLLQMNQAAEALDAIRTGVSLDPSQVYPRLTLASTLWRLSQKEEALKEARAALELAQTDAERRAAQSLIDSFSR